MQLRPVCCLGWFQSQAHFFGPYFHFHLFARIDQKPRDWDYISNQFECGGVSPWGLLLCIQLATRKLLLDFLPSISQAQLWTICPLCTAIMERKVVLLILSYIQSWGSRCFLLSVSVLFSHVIKHLWQAFGRKESGVIMEKKSNKKPPTVHD